MDTHSNTDAKTPTQRDILFNLDKDILSLPDDVQQSYMQFHTQKLILSRKYTKTKLSNHQLIVLLITSYATPLRIDLANHSKSTVSQHLGLNPNVITTILSVIQYNEEEENTNGL